MKKSLYQKICQICPLCKYTRSCKKKDWKYFLFKRIEGICIICRLAKKKKISYCEFENRYPLGVAKKNKAQSIFISKADIFQENSSSEESEIINYFKKIITTDQRLKELNNLQKLNNKKIIGTFCNFVPEELIYACDYIPVRLCAGCYETISKAEEILPRDICPLIKSSFGFKLIKESYFSICDLVIIPTTCDGKMKLGEILNNYIPVYILELPRRKDIKKFDLWLNEIKKLKTKLETFTGRKITRKKLKESVLLLKKRSSIFRQFYNLRKNNPLIINGIDAFFVMQASFYDDIHRWINNTQILCQKLQENRISDTQSVRLLLTGAPVIWPNFKLLNIASKSGASIVADELCSGTQYLYNLVEVDEWTEEGILKAIATKYLYPSTCPCFIESEDRIDRLLNLIKEFNIEGVIYHSLRLCQLYDIESYKVRQILKDNKIPVLNIYTDYSYEDVEQLKTRIEAFLEIIKKPK